MIYTNIRVSGFVLCNEKKHLNKNKNYLNKKAFESVIRRENPFNNTDKVIGN